MTEDTPIVAACPNCKRLHEDLDGFGVLYCEHCKWCSHASISGSRCDFCGSESMNSKTDKKIAFGCWSNEMHVIAERGQAGVLHGRLFQTEKAAREFYGQQCSRIDGDRIVRVTCEDLGPVFP